MNPRLSPGRRRLLLFVSAASLTAWYAGVGDPLAAQDAGPAGRASLSVPSDRSAPPDVARAIRRDPFVGGPEDRPVGGTLASGSNGAAPEAPGTPGSARGAGSQEATVPDIVPGAMPSGAAVASATQAKLALRATIIGPNPVAYVDDGSDMQIVRVGDTIGDRRIVAIDLHGVVFADGSRLDLAEDAGPATPAVVTHARNSEDRPLTIRDLKRLLRPPAEGGSQTAARVPTAEPAAQDTPAPYQLEGTAPTSPLPLPTANPNGLQPGDNPTPDLTAPTAFPYPYPYPPPSRHR